MKDLKSILNYFSTDFTIKSLNPDETLPSQQNISFVVNSLILFSI